MKRASLHKMSVADLVERFVAIALEQDKALLWDDHAKFNRLYGEMDAVREELKSRPGDQRRALLPLYRHPNMQVRLKAAVSTLAVARPEAEEMLRAIVDSGWFPQAGDAGMLVRGLDDGSWQPT
jgi:hypothetical protein